MTEAILTINHPNGLHARPGALFVQTAARFPATQIRFQNLSRPGGREIDAKSMLQLLQANVRNGDQIRVTADGPQADEALEALRALVARNFEEQP